MELDSQNPYAPYFAGCALGMHSRQAEALVQFQRALEIEPRHVWAWLGLGWMHLDLGSGSEAIWCLEKAVELERLQGPHRTAGVSGFLGECLRRLGEPEKARARCLEGLEAVEKSDNMYWDTFRGVCLCTLGRAALDCGDAATAVVAFHQAVSHLRGRPRTLGGGHLLVQALSGLARAGEGRLRTTRRRASGGRASTTIFRTCGVARRTRRCSEVSLAAAAPRQKRRAGQLSRLLKRVWDGPTPP